MNSSDKGVLLAVGAYVVTMAVAIFIILIAIIIILAQSLNCSDMSRALLVLWATIATLCLASVVVVVLIARKFVPGTTGRKMIVAGYGAAVLVSYVVIAFGLMVLFNC